MSVGENSLQAVNLGQIWRKDCEGYELKVILPSV